MANGTKDGKQAAYQNQSSRQIPAETVNQRQDFDSLRILVIDDSEVVVEVIKRFLERLGVTTVMQAHDGRQALTVLDATTVDIVLCDLQMPGMDGIEFLRHLAEREASPSVILLSGYDKSVLSTAVRLGCAHGLRIVGSLTKPFNYPSLKLLLIQSGAVGENPSRLSFQPLTPEAVRDGLEHDAIELAFQPKVATNDSELTGVEALLRWRSHEGNIVSPAEVIPVAEQHELMDRLTQIVVVKALAQHGAWLKEGHRFTLAINVSLLDLCRYDFPEFILDTAASAGVAPTSIVLEVTETQLMADIARPLETLSRLRLNGVGLAIDDYGTGASALQQLKRIPFTELKIDREFVAGAPEDKATRTMQGAIVRLAKSLHLGIVAEGVETESEWRLVASRGVDAVQGYYIARPMSAKGISEWIASAKRSA